MKQLLKKVVAIGALALVILGSPKKSEAGIGVISLIGGPGGVPVIVAGAGLMIGGSAAVLGTCYVGQKVANWSEDCPIFMNFTFWPGLVLLNTEGSTNSLAKEIVDKYAADLESANRIADRIYNKALKASRKLEKEERLNEGEALVVKLEVAISKEELLDLSSPEFISSEGFIQMIQDYE